VTWATLGYLGLPWATLGYLGLPRAYLGFLGRAWACLGYSWDNLPMRSNIPRSALCATLDTYNLYLVLTVFRMLRGNQQMQNINPTLISKWMVLFIRIISFSILSMTFVLADVALAGPPFEPGTAVMVSCLIFWSSRTFNCP
jgi:hypothetical protein